MTTPLTPSAAPATPVVPFHLALALAPQVLALFNPLAGAALGLVAQQWAAYLAGKNLPPDFEATPELIAEFRADVAANSAAAIHARARAAAQPSTPPSSGN